MNSWWIPNLSLTNVQQIKRKKQKKGIKKLVKPSGDVQSRQEPRIYQVDMDVVPGWRVRPRRSLSHGDFVIEVFTSTRPCLRLPFPHQLLETDALYVVITTL